MLALMYTSSSIFISHIFRTHCTHVMWMFIQHLWISSALEIIKGVLSPNTTTLFMHQNIIILYDFLAIDKDRSYRSQLNRHTLCCPSPQQSISFLFFFYLSIYFTLNNVFWAHLFSEIKSSLISIYTSKLYTFEYYNI